MCNYFAHFEQMLIRKKDNKVIKDKRTKGTKFLSGLMALFLSFSAFTPSISAIPVITANAEENGKITVINFPTSGDAVAQGVVWGHKGLVFKNEWQSDTNDIDKVVTPALMIDGKAAYNLEPGLTRRNGENLTYDSNYFMRSRSNDILQNTEIGQYINYVLTFGYQGSISNTWVSQNASDADKMGNYIATQMLVYEIVVGERDEHFNHVSASPLHEVMEQISSEHPVRSYILSHYNRIETSVKEMIRIPSFMSHFVHNAEEIKFNADNTEKEIIFQDTNHVLSNFDLSVNNPSVTVSVNNDTVKLVFPKGFTDNVTLSATKKENQNVVSSKVWNGYGQNSTCAVANGEKSLDLEAFINLKYVTEYYLQADYGKDAISVLPEKTVTVNFATSQNTVLYALEGNWSTHELGDTSYLTLTELKPYNNSVNPDENNTEDGKVYWLNVTNPLDLNENDVIWQATYSVSSETPANIYYVSFDIEAIGATTGEKEDITLTQMILVDETKKNLEVYGISDTYTYIGKQIIPDEVVYYGDKLLTKNIDYKASYGENINVGNGFVTISPAENSGYTFEPYTKNFSIISYQLHNEDVAVPEEVRYTGNSLSVPVAVTVNGNTLTENQDYTVSFENPDGAIGESLTVIVIGINNCCTDSPIKKTVRIVPKPYHEIDEYEDKSISTLQTLTFTDTKMFEVTFSTENTDIVEITHSHFSAESINIIKPVGIGTATINVTYPETEEYSETTRQFTVTVRKGEISVTNVSIANKQYDGNTSANVSGISFSNDVVLTEETDFEITSANFCDSNVGTYKDVIVVVRLIGNANDLYSLVNNNITTSGNITPMIITEDMITLSQTEFEYDGNSKEPVVSVTCNGKQLVLNTDFELNYWNNKDAGTGYVDIQGKGNYDTQNSQKIEKTFVISKKNITPTTDDLPVMEYSGREIKPSVIVRYNGNVLIQNSDYVITYSNNINVGTGSYKIQPTENGNYSFEDINGTFTIIPLEINRSNITITPDVFKYDGNEKIPQVIISINDITLTENVDYEVSYENNIDKGTAKAIVTGKGNYSTARPIEMTFSIVQNVITPNVAVSPETNTENVEYVLEYSDNINVGAGKAIVKCKDNLNFMFSDIEVTFDIVPNIIKESDVTLEYNSTEYDGNIKEPQVTISVSNKSLTKGTDFDVAYENNTDVGQGTVKIIGKGNYSTDSDIILNFEITKKILALTVTDFDDVSALIYNGKAQTPDVNFKNAYLVKDIDYTLSYSNNVNASKQAIVIISPVVSSNYAFETIQKQFEIKPFKLETNNFGLEYYTVRYDGSAKTPHVISFVGELPLTFDDYSVVYENNTEIGEGKAVITVNSNNFVADDSIIKTFNIVGKDIVTFSGIENDQNITYTGKKVVLNGELKASSTIDMNAVKTIWYDEDGSIIDQPINVGRYAVTFSYSDDEYEGKLTVNFGIAKAKSELPYLGTVNGIVGDTLSTILLPPYCSWVNVNEIIQGGAHEYNAVFVQNGDSTNYTTETIKFSIFGKHKININVENVVGGTCPESIIGAIEGTEHTLKFTPDEGYELSEITVNGISKTINQNSIVVKAGSEDLNVVASFNKKTYTLSINTENATVNVPSNISVEYGENKEIEIIPNFGYKVTSVLVNNVEKVSSIVNDKLLLNNIKKNVVVNIIAEKIIYPCILGNGQTYLKGSNIFPYFEFDADMILFDFINIDGNTVDLENYSIKQGSTIVMFTKDYWESLSVGVHTLDVFYRDGGISTAKFIVKEKENEDVSTSDIDSTSTTNSTFSTSSTSFALTTASDSTTVFATTSTNSTNSTISTVSTKLSTTTSKNTSKTNTSSDSVDNAKTGDDSLLPIILLSLLSFGVFAAIYVIRSRKKELI